MGFQVLPASFHALPHNKDDTAPCIERAFASGQEPANKIGFKTIKSLLRLFPRTNG
jgi:hypothetical protein